MIPANRNILSWKNLLKIFKISFPVNMERFLKNELLLLLVIFGSVLFFYFYFFFLVLDTWIEYKEYREKKPGPLTVKLVHA